MPRGQTDYPSGKRAESVRKRKTNEFRSRNLLRTFRERRILWTISTNRNTLRNSDPQWVWQIFMATLVFPLVPTTKKLLARGAVRGLLLRVPAFEIPHSFDPQPTAQANRRPADFFEENLTIAISLAIERK